MQRGGSEVCGGRESWRVCKLEALLLQIPEVRGEAGLTSWCPKTTALGSWFLLLLFWFFRSGNDSS